MANLNPEQNSIPSTIKEVPIIKEGELPGQVTPSLPTSSNQPSTPSVVLPTLDTQIPITQIDNSKPEDIVEAKNLEKKYSDAKNLDAGNAFVLMNEINKDIFGATSDK